MGLVGQGQFGQVYCAIHRKTGRLVALKNLNRDRFPTHQFLRELRFLLSLNHPHIANCLALEQSANGRQLVLDYCEGGTLRDILEQETSLSLAEILTLIYEVLDALEHAQKEKIVHCDIKPENILLVITPDGWQAKVSDFGIARLSQEFLGGHTGATGSPAYMAPERFYKQYAVSSDLYAVGIVLYEVLLGDRPFSGSYNQLMVAHLNHAVPIPATVPEAVRSLLSKSLEKLMARRFQSAAEMKAALVAARKTLTAMELRLRFPKPITPTPTSQFIKRYATALPADCSGLSILQSSITSPTLISYGQQTAWQWTLHPQSEPAIAATLQQQWQLEPGIKRVIDTVSGAIAVTDRELYRLQPGHPPQRLTAFKEPIALVPGGQHWLVVQRQQMPHQFDCIDVRQETAVNTRALTISAPKGRLLTLLMGDRYLLAADTLEAKTHLQVISRRGQHCGQLTLNAPLHQLWYGAQTNRLLAQAGSHKRDLLVIQLKPYRVMRCRLDISVDWVGELVTGYAVVSAEGQLQLLNFQGQLIGHVKHLPIPTAIVFQAPHHIWLYSKQEEDSQLHCIDVRHLNLDIVF